MIGTENEPIYVVDSFSMIHAAYVGWKNVCKHEKAPAMILMKFDMVGTMKLILKQLKKESPEPLTFNPSNFLACYIGYSMIHRMHEITLRHIEATKYGIGTDVAPRTWFGYGPLTEEISHSDAVQGVQEQFFDCGRMLGWAAQRCEDQLQPLFEAIHNHFYHSNALSLPQYFGHLLDEMADASTPMLEKSLERDYENLVGGNPVLKKQPQDWGKLREIECRMAKEDKDMPKIKRFMVKAHTGSELLLDLPAFCILPLNDEYQKMISNPLTLDTDDLEDICMEIAEAQHRENLLVCKMFPEKAAEYEVYLRKLRGEDEPTEVPSPPQNNAELKQESSKPVQENSATTAAPPCAGRQADGSLTATTALKARIDSVKPLLNCKRKWFVVCKYMMWKGIVPDCDFDAAKTAINRIYPDVDFDTHDFATKMNVQSFSRPHTEWKLGDGPLRDRRTFNQYLHIATLLLNDNP